MAITGTFSQKFFRYIQREKHDMENGIQGLLRTRIFSKHL